MTKYNMVIVARIHCTEQYAQWFRRQLAVALDDIVWCHDPSPKTPTLYKFTIDEVTA